MIRRCSALVQIYCFLFSRFTLAALQNITVDDAVLTGAVVPQYLPSTSDWNIGNTCSGCLVQPDPSQAYNGTWHDTTYSANNSYTQTIEFTFTGSALYIFFILANTVPSATTLTYVNFNLDGTTGPPFQHTPSTSTAYEYNQAVYSNDSLPYGQHTMTIEPVNSGSNVLILFDYLIYSVDTGTTTITSAGEVVTFVTTQIPETTSTDSAASGQVITTISLASATQTASGSPSSGSTSSSGLNIGAIIGGTVGGIVLVSGAAYAFCYRPYKRRTVGQPPSTNVATVEPFIISPQMDLVSSGGSSLPVHPMAWESPLTLTTSQSKTNASPTVQASIPPSSLPASSTASGALSSGSTAEILEQVGLLRDEVAHLRELQTQNREITELESEAPPGYYR